MHSSRLLLEPRMDILSVTMAHFQLETNSKPEESTSDDFFASPQFLRMADITEPSVPLITPPQYTGEKLNCEKRNYKLWLDSVRIALGLTGLLKHTEPDAAPPDATCEPYANANWHENDRRVCWFLFSTCSPAEKDVIGEPTKGVSAAAYWKKLEDRYMTEEQVKLIKEAFFIRATEEEPWVTTLDRAWDLIDRAWSMAPMNLEVTKRAFGEYALEKSTPSDSRPSNRDRRK